MKLKSSDQKKLAQDFLASFYSKLGREEELADLDPQLSEALKEISLQHSQDLLTNLWVNFSWPSLQDISYSAGERLAHLWLEDGPDRMAEPGSHLRQLWHELAVDFHRSNYWNFPQQESDPVLPVDEKALREKEGLSYIWMALQSLIFMKIIILVFGIRYSNEPNLQNALVFFSVLFLAFGGLFFFAYRWRKRSS